MKGKRMYIRIAIGAIVGGVLGYLVLYKLIGCHTGTCPITRNPYTSIIFGAAMGAAVAGGA